MNEKEIERDLELDIPINRGSAVVMSDNRIEMTDCQPFTVEELERLIKEIKDFIEYKKERKWREKNGRNK